MWLTPGNAILGAGTALLILTACGGGSLTDSKASQEDAAVSQRPIQEVVDEHASEWMKIDGVVGVGITKCEGVLCIQVLVLPEKMQDVQALFPETIEGYKIVFAEQGPIHAL